MNNVEAEINRHLTQELVRESADGIKATLGPRFTRRRMFTLAGADIPWKSGLMLLALFLIFVVVTAIGGTFHFSSTALYYLYSSVFQGLCALLALIFTFSIFAYRRGEEKETSLSKKAEDRLRRVFRDVELLDSIEAKTWLWLWEKAHATMNYSSEEWRHYDAAKRTLGQLIHEGEVLSGLIIRTVAVVMPFVLLIAGSLQMLAFGVEYGSAPGNSTAPDSSPVSESPVYQLVPIAMILGVAFSITWFLTFAISVFISIDMKKSEFFTAKACFTQAELEACLPDIKNAAVEEIDALLAKSH